MLQRIILIICLVGGLSQSVLAQPVAYIGEPKLYYGASYYPETWPKENVAQDIKYMQDLGMNVMRMAEFSWSKMEPNEGEYDFAWLKDIMDQLHAGGISVILGTPTATPPAWLWEKHPEIARVDDHGLVAYHGARKDYRYTSRIYQAYSVKIVEKMAEALGDHPALIGWQIDNEFSIGKDFSRETEVQFQDWLKAKYKTIENLNQLWATDLWSQKYDRFEQIPLPRSWTWHHPSLQLDFKRFSSQKVTEFQSMQINVIRKHSKQPITHDTMPGQELNYEEMMRDADFMAVNNYHSFEAYDRVVSNYDRMRGYGKGMHWLFETAPNNSGGGKKGQTWFLHRPDGSMHAALWMNYALGGQGALFWLWRQHRAGQEMPHGAILHTWGKPAANYDDLKQLGADLKKSSDFLVNAPVLPAKCAIMYSHEADMGLRIEQTANDLRYYTDWSYRFYLAFQDAYLHRDVLMPGASIEDHDLLFLPLLPMITPDLRGRLKNWVNNGGTLLLGPMSGYRTEHWAGYTDHAMGDLEDWIGIEVQSRIPIGTKPRKAEGTLMLDFASELGIADQEAQLWSEALASESGKVMATYQGGMHKGKAAIIENKVGKGKVVLLGTDPSRAALSKMLTHYAKEKGITPMLSGEPGVLAVPRKGSDQEGLILDNIVNGSRTLTLPSGSYQDILSGKTVRGKYTLQPYEVLVLKKQ